MIDGQDISFIDRSWIRQRISCLSQEPFLFPGTIRQNADPLNVITDRDIINALQCVGLWDALAATSSHGEAVLDAKLDDSILSHGQRQLFCLARALLKKSKVLILGEPTSRYVHIFFYLVTFCLPYANQNTAVWIQKQMPKSKRSFGNRFMNVP